MGAMARRKKLFFGLCLVFYSAALPGFTFANPEDDHLELAIKAAYIYKLGQFVAWPAGIISTSFVICVVGDKTIGPLLEQVAQGQTVHQHPITLQLYPDISRNPGCQVLYIPAAAPQFSARILAEVQGQPVLTITDGATGAAATGMINLVLMDGFVRFAINNKAATAAGLDISSKLLSLAVNVQDLEP